MASSEGNVVSIVMRVPPLVRASTLTLTVTVGMSGSPRSNWRRRGASTARMRHQPCDRSPSGPVTKYDTFPPGRRSCSTTVAGAVG
jgi:hypothetical protein